ncbi:hypothetical protein AOA80_10570 [Methanomassiliicoccales archaeon RumEn M1]|nr:hypothetical protein AOA80_10570 [Methanomassiliicoccales archaeon RumEn M1]
MQEDTSETGEETFEFDCPECGAHIIGEASHCPSCGIEFVIEEVTEGEEDEGDEPDAAEDVGTEDAEAGDPPEAADPEALKEEFSSLVDELRPRLELAERHGADTSGARRLMDKAVSAGKRRDVEEAVTVLRECRSVLDAEIVDRLEQDLCHLESLVEVAEAAGSDVAGLRGTIDNARSLKESGDMEGAFREVGSGERMAEKLSGRFIEANSLYEALERAVLNAERFYLDVREVRGLLNEAREAKERADWTTMGILAKKGRDELSRILPELISAELRRAKQSLLDAKAAGRDVSSMVKILRAAGVEAKRGRCEEALERLVEFRDEEEAS